MKYLDYIVDALAREAAWRYQPRSEPASEPTALVALALAAYGRDADAERARAWLAAAQNADGSVGVRAADHTPGWPTPLALLAWTLHDSPKSLESPSASDSPDYADCCRRATQWMLATVGESSPRQEYTGHDTSLTGWPWVVGTHSWVEPTAMSLLALRAVGLGKHARAREAATLLQDRLLDRGGCNYGNTVVLDQQLLPHVQPTGLALLALSGKEPATPLVAAALDYLAAELGPMTTAASLAWGLLGLAAFDRWPDAADSWLSAAAARAKRRGASHEMALLALAGLKQRSPLVHLNRQIA
ncbi:MAG TPA: hypothetical protein VGJ26_12445 [Pirellulales bacterium]|jgi:hypothetical protein